ncbi:glutathione peroxidase [Shewanella marina]|uniref:glutathione peroxidase n=1 Tax=Shewanella marina TaxID=487319 RepID=UPI000471646B|nr:glutathione peroxidase [Shewanella marina]
MSNDIYQFVVDDIQGNKVELSQFKGQVLLIVNTASKCGFTPQYEQLEQLYQQYKVQGFSILGFPCNQFAHQEPADNQQIAQFCQLNYQVSFPLFAKVDVNGNDASELYRFLSMQAKGLLGSSSVKWNFTKFLVNREGKVLSRFAPTTTPLSLKQAIESLL